MGVVGERQDRVQASIGAERRRGSPTAPASCTPAAHRRLRLIGEAERQAAAAALDEAAAAAKALGASTEAVGSDGEPGRVLSWVAEESNCQLVALAARMDRRDEPPSPRSVGHAARFVLDTARGPSCSSEAPRCGELLRYLSLAGSLGGGCVHLLSGPPQHFSQEDVWPEIS